MSTDTVMMLAAWLQAAEGRAFRFGRHDCVRFAAGWVREATGRDVLADWPYASLRAGEALLAARGLADLRAAVGTVLPEVAPLAARVGDLALIDGGFGPGLGIVTGAEVVGLRRGRGLVRHPLSDALTAWRVG